MTDQDQKKIDLVKDIAAINQDEMLESIGECLKRAREARGEQIDRIAKILRISQSYLEALEADDRSRLPEQVYALGFLKSYAAYLGLDPNELVKNYKVNFLRLPRPENLAFPMPIPAKTIPGGLLIFIALGLAILVIGAWLLLKPSYQAADEFKHLAPPTAVVSLDESPSAPESEKETTSVVAQQPEKLYTQPYPVFPVQDARPYQETRAATAVIKDKDIYLSQGKSFIILATAETWVEVKTRDRQTLINRTLKSGEKHEIKTQDGLTLSTGNAGGLSFYVNGKYFANLGKPGEVLTGMTLKFEGK